MSLLEKIKEYTSEIIKRYRLEEKKGYKLERMRLYKKEKAIVDNRIHAGFIVENKPKSIVAEAYRTLRTNIQYSSFDKKIKTIVVTSAEMAEGKSTVAGNIALSFAQNEKKVILVDCDLRKPSVHKNFKASNLVGVSEVLLGKVILQDALQRRNDNFYFLTSGKIPPNPSEMLASLAMTKLIEILKEEFDIVVLDTAPLKAVTDAQILSTKVDGTILVVRAARTKRDVVVEAKNLLDKVGANIIGTVLQAVENTRGKYYYYYGNDEDEDN
jgi:capsular exopolysaccharide synthesis family protein